MLNKLEQLRKNKESGFTIIEVMIVLAIAGLILLIVLLAVPALQRNSRNTQIRNDAASLVGAISTFATDNDGAVPNTITKPADGETVTLSIGAPATATKKSTIKIQAGTTVNAVAANKPSDDSIEPGELYPVTKKACDSDSTVNRSMAIYYAVETSDGTKVNCVSS